MLVLGGKEARPLLFRCPVLAHCSDRCALGQRARSQQVHAQTALRVDGASGPVVERVVRIMHGCTQGVMMMIYTRIGSLHFHAAALRPRLPAGVTRASSVARAVSALSAAVQCRCASGAGIHRSARVQQLGVHFTAQKRERVHAQ